MLTLWADALSVPTVRRVLVPTEPHFGSIGPADEHEPLHSVRCRNVTYECTEERLRQTFARFGPVASCVIVRDAHSGLSKGTAFVKFRSKEAADAAVEAANPSNPVHVLTRAQRCARTPGAIA
jgi:RNA recognition motif-containing protein